MKLLLSLVKNDHLLKKFPKDPEWDVTIVCNDYTFKLQIAFLFIESCYFDRMFKQHTKEISLHQLDEDDLSNVLSVLYGGELVIKDFEVLARIYTVLEFLEIDTLLQATLTQLQDQIDALNLIQLLEFAYQHNVLVQQVSLRVLDNELYILRDPMYSMQLNKISPKVLTIILLEYSSKSRCGKEVIDGNISAILSDYFHTNRIKPEDFFQKHHSEILKQIWFKSHPVYVPHDSPDKLHQGQDQRPTLQQRIKDLELLRGRQDQLIANLKDQNRRLILLSESAQHKTCTKSGQLLPNEIAESTRTVCTDTTSKVKYPPMAPSRANLPTNQEQALQTNRKVHITHDMKTLQSIKKNPRNNSRGHV